MQGMWFSMNDWSPEVIHKRFKEVCPVERIDMMPVDEVIKSIHVAFKIIGYTPNNFDKALDCAYETSHSDYLADYIFDVWRCDFNG